MKAGRGYSYSDETLRKAMYWHTTFGYGCERIARYFREYAKEGKHNETPPAPTVSEWINHGNKTIDRIKSENPRFLKVL